MDTPAQHDALALDAPAAPDTWLSAIRGLRDNPLARALKIAHGRKSKRFVAFYWLASLLVAISIAVFQFQSILPHVKSGMVWIGYVWINAAQGILQTLWLFWFSRAMYLASTTWLGCLNRQQPVKLRLIDESLTHSKLTDKEIITAVAASSLKILILPALLAIIVMLVNQWIAAFNESGMPAYSASAMPFRLGAQYGQALDTSLEVWRIMVRGLPRISAVSAAGLALGACLAIVNLYLLLLGIGCRSVSTWFINVEAGLITGLQVGWVFAGATLGARWFFFYMEPEYLKLPVLGDMNAVMAAVLLFAGLVSSILFLPRRWGGYKGALFAIAGFLQVALAIQFCFGIWFYGEPTAPKALSATFIYLNSAFNVINPMLVSSGMFTQEFTDYHKTELVRAFYGLQLSKGLFIPLIQLILLPILARFALNAVRRYRQAAE